MSVLAVSGLRAGVEGREILRGVDLMVQSGEVHAVMGPNGSGKSTLSHVIMGRPGYEVLGGTVTLDGTDLLALPTWRRARLGLFLALQYPTEVPGVSLTDALAEGSGSPTGERPTGGDWAERIAGEAQRIGFDRRFLDRSLNEDLSGGEKKRSETLQLVVLAPKIAILDELDSGLDVDALQAVARRVEDATRETGLGVLAITHYSRLLRVLRPDVVHVLRGGRIAASGGPELAEELERTGYAGYQDDTEGADDAEEAGPAGDPFADPLA